MGGQINLNSESKNTGIFLRVTEGFNKTVDTILENSSMVSDLKSKGYNIEKSVLGRFGYLLVCRNLQLLSKNPDLLLAASKQNASDEMLSTIEKEMSN